MRKLIAFFIAVLILNVAQAQKVNRRYTFQPQPNNTDIPSSFVELSDGTIMLVWTSFRANNADSCFIHARKILKSGVAGPIITLDAFPYYSGAIWVESAALAKEKFGLIYNIPVANSQQCTIVFSSFNADGFSFQKRKAISNSNIEEMNHLAISSAPDGKYALGWQEFTDIDHSRFMMQTFDAKDVALSAPFVFDSAFSLSANLQKIDFKNGKLVAALLDQKSNEFPRLAFRTFSEKGIPLCEKTIVNESDSAGTKIVSIDLKFISNTEFVLSWVHSKFDPNTEARKVYYSNITAGFYDLQGKMSCVPKTIADSAEVISSINFAVQKGKIQFVWLDEKEGNNRLMNCGIDKSKREVPDSAIVLEKMQPTVGFGTVICRPTSKYKYFEMHREFIRYSNQTTISFAYFLWKEKKPKAKKVKEPKKKKEKEKKPEEKKDEVKGNSGNGRG